MDKYLKPPFAKPPFRLSRFDHCCNSGCWGPRQILVKCAKSIIKRKKTFNTTYFLARLGSKTRKCFTQIIIVGCKAHKSGLCKRGRRNSVASFFCVLRFYSFILVSSVFFFLHFPSVSLRFPFSSFFSVLLFFFLPKKKDGETPLGSARPRIKLLRGTQTAPRKSQTCSSICKVSMAFRIPAPRFASIITVTSGKEKAHEHKKSYR